MAKVAIAVGIAVLVVVAAPIAAATISGLALGTAAESGFLAGVGAFGAFTGAAGATAAIAAWGTVGLAAVGALTAPKVGQGRAGSQVNFQADPNAGIPLMLGRSATAGKIIHGNTSGQADKNASLYYLVALTGGPLGRFEKMTLTGTDAAFNGPATGGDGACFSPPQYAGKMHLTVTPGNKPDAVTYYPPGLSAAQYPEWTAGHNLSGVSCAWWVMDYDVKVYPTGVPQPLFVIDGPSVYDPRGDSTYPGGSGAQRWNDPTTWTQAGINNPFLQGLAWCIGRFDNGKLTHGIGAPIAAIDLNAFVYGANVCDANAWTVGGEVLSSPDRKWDVLTSILQAGGGEPVQLGGLISCFVRTPRVILATMVGSDTVGPISITGTKRRRDRLNQIIPTYRSEANGWQLVPAGAVTVNEYIPADGGLRSKEGNYPLVQDAKQVAQLAAYDILDAREFEPITVPLGPRWLSIKPGDCIQITEPEFGMGEGQPVIVQSRSLDLTSGVVTLSCRSETTGKHDYALGRTANPPPIPGLVPSDPTYVAAPDPGSWQAVGGVLTGADGSQVPAIIVTGAVNDPNVAGVIVEYALELGVGPPATFGEWVSGEFPATVRRVELRAVISGATYHVQVRYRSVRDVEAHLVLDLGLVTVGTLISHGVTQIGGQTPQELIDQLNETTALGEQTAAQATQTANDLLFTNQNLHDKTTLADGQDLETYTVNSVNTLTTSSNYSVVRVDAIGILRPGGSTFQMSDATLYADATTTWGNYKQALSVSMGNNTAAITAEQTARIAGDQANATSITNLTTTVNGNSANITTLQNSVNGLNAQWVLSVSSTGAGYARVAGIKVAATPAVSSIAFQADQIGFTDGSTNVFPLAVTGGKVIATNFQADDIKANTITTNKIVANNISVATWAGLPAQVLLPLGSGAAVDLITTTVNCSGGYISLDIWGTANVGGQNDTMTFQLFVDGASVATFGGAAISGTNYNQTTFKYRHKPAAGNHTYKINGYRGNTNSAITLTNMMLNVTDHKTEA